MSENLVKHRIEKRLNSREESEEVLRLA